MFPLGINIDVHVRNIEVIMRSHRSAFIKQVASMKDLSAAGLGQNVCVLDADVLGFWTAIGS